MVTDRKFETVPSDRDGLLQIRALRKVRGADGTLRARAGDLGGYVESGDNLAQHSSGAWIAENATVTGRAYVTGDGYVYGDAQVSEDARVDGRAIVRGYARIHGAARVDGYAEIEDRASIGGTATTISDGTFGGFAYITSPTDFLTIRPTPWGALTVARDLTGHRITCGCQRFTLGMWRAVLDAQICDCGGSCHNDVDFIWLWERAELLLPIAEQLIETWAQLPTPDPAS